MFENKILGQFWFVTYEAVKNEIKWEGRLVSSCFRALEYRAEDRGFKPQTGPTLRVSI